MTTIRNKQTGETLTGEHIIAPHEYINFKIRGCRGAVSLDASEWDILPPPLPTGIGAVVRDGRDRVYIRISSDGEYPWSSGESLVLYGDRNVTKCGPLTILSEGWNP